MMEERVAGILEWRLAPRTLNACLCAFIARWDEYVRSAIERHESSAETSSASGSDELTSPVLLSGKLILRRLDEGSYWRYRGIMAIADLMLLDAEIYAYEFERLSLAILAVNLVICLGTVQNISLESFEEALGQNSFKGILDRFLEA